MRNGTDAEEPGIGIYEVLGFWRTVQVIRERAESIEERTPKFVIGNN